MNRDTICMLIHGFGGGPFELEALKTNLESSGIKAYDLILPGHLSGKKGLRHCKYTDWIHAVEKQFTELRAQNKDAKIIVVGFSMGGLLGAHLAKYYDVDALITLNTPIRYWNIRRVLLNIEQDIASGRLDAIKRYVYSCTMYPLNALWHFKRLLRTSKSNFKSITCPVLVVQAMDDDAVHYKSAEYIIGSVLSAEKKCIYIEKGGHGILLGSGTEETVHHVCQFIGERG